MALFMGEFSKYVGEVGEEIVDDFLRLFGWKNMCSNKELSCCISTHKKKTHGIDALFLYPSPLQKQSLVSVVVSAKYSSNPYSNIKTTFKSHFTDIAHTVDCYSKSQLKRSLTKAFKGSSRKDDIGVLFYLNNDESGDKDNIKSYIANSRLDSSLKFSVIHVIDNARADFLYSSLSFIKSKYSLLEFFCNGTTLKVGTSKSHSRVMPVEYITSPIIPVSIMTEGGRKLVLLCDFDFSKESLELVYKLARKLCAEFTNHYEVYFKTYSKLRDAPVVDEVKMSAQAEGLNCEDDYYDMENFPEPTLIVGTYNQTFRNDF
ncbi:hypothetical protein ACOMICROBIO_NCLOACGD_00962 [Vibrio sp. B1ASS3]|jgi:hypothetical protein|nr:hypothetical protein ACOMICROBIO_NCLOACGD_00962 [Vibrio sp. B1ASS3]CAE6891994.1 hypothetical protein ACOMICROBIO_NCLOACGD_00962 [Vibrio sp. B1ASS3]